MGVPVKGDLRIAIAGTHSNISVEDLTDYIIAKFDERRAEQAKAKVPGGHGPKPDPKEDAK